MQGFPKNPNSRTDYQNIINDFGYSSEVKQAYQALLNTDHHYIFDRELTPGEDPDGPEPEFKIVDEQRPDGSVKQIQYKLIDNPDSKLKQLGFTVREIEEVINHA